MSWLDELEDASQNDLRGPRCKTCLWLDGLDANERAEVEEAMARPLGRVKHTVLYDFVVERWPDCGLTRDSLVNHRRGRCRGAR